MEVRIGAATVIALGLALASCAGNDGTAADGGEATAAETPVESGATTPAASDEAATAAGTKPAAARVAGEGEFARYGDAAYAVGDRVELAQRAGLIEDPAGRGKVVAAAGQQGTVTAVLDPEGLVEITWDAQDWTLHGGYSWEGKENIGLEDVQEATSRSAGTLHLESFATPVHVRFLAHSRD